MKVLLVSLQKRGGGALDLLGFSGGLCENEFKHEVVLSSYNEFCDRLSDNEYRKVIKVKTYSGGMASFLGALVLLRPIRFMRSVVKMRPDMIHILDFHAWMIFLYLARPFCGFKMIYSPQDDPFSPKESNPPLMNFLEKFFVRHADEVIAYSKVVGTGLEKHISKKVVVMPLGVYPRVYGEFEKNFTGEGTLNILFLGRIEPYKGVDTLIDAYRILKDKNSDVCLTIAGRGNLPAGSAKAVKDLGIALKNYWLSNEEIGSLIGSADVIAAPYKEITQSAVVMTAISYLVPVIVTDVGSLSDYVKDGYNGFVVSSGDAPAVAESVLKLLKNRDLVSQMSQNQKTVCETFSWGNVSKKAIEVYGSLREAVK